MHMLSAIKAKMIGHTQQNNLKKDLGNLSLVYIDNMLVNMLSRYHQDT